MSTGQLDEFNLDGEANDDVHSFNFLGAKTSTFDSTTK